MEKCENMDIVCITSDSRLLHLLSSKYEGEMIRFIDFSEVQDFSTSHIYLIISPIYNNRSYIYYDVLWKRFLLRKFPDSILISAGFLSGPRENYLNLLDLPLSIREFLHPLKSVKRHVMPPLPYGERMEDKIHQFFKGHGKESVLDALNKICRKLHLIDREIAKYGSSYKAAAALYLDTEYTQEQWTKFEVRWKNYFELFNYTPFRHEWKLLNDMISFMAPFFEKGCKEENLYFNLNIWENAQKLLDKFTEIRDQYDGTTQL